MGRGIDDIPLTLHGRAAARWPVTGATAPLLGGQFWGGVRAHSLAAVIGDDGDNLLTILTAKEINPDLSVAARANDFDERRLVGSGALHRLPQLGRVRGGAA